MGKMFKGMCVPICTPFVEGGEAVDEGALKAHIDWLLEGGIHIILACGGTGEFAYLREAERRRVAEVTVRHVAGRADVFVQTSAINTADAVANSKAALDVGADAIMILPPYFEGPSMDGVRWPTRRSPGRSTSRSSSTTSRRTPTSTSRPRSSPSC
jgi:4-hydroxy-tetrahydrodipicolinate synthase